jgi:quinol---cytochrome c reductase iron-sulfur subunit, bacillus type
MDDPEIHGPDPKIQDPERCRFFGNLGVICGSIAGVVVAIPAVSFLLGLRKAPRDWRVLGKVEEFPLGQTTLVSFLDPSPLPWAGVTAKTAAWLRREEEQKFIAFSVNCTHLGCPVRWLPEADRLAGATSSDTSAPR